MISLNSISKSYSKNNILDALDLKFAPGKTTALLGPNGSGKTTIIKLILGLVKADTGFVEVNGHDVSDSWQYRSAIGYMPQIARYPDNLTVQELLDMISDLRDEKSEKVSSLIEVFELEQHLAKSMKSLSGGTRQKVSAVLALMFNTPILILDEPTAGLDPVMARRFKDSIAEEKLKGKTILLTTHVLGEIEELADDIAFILEGHVLYHNSKEELLRQTKCSEFERAIAALQEGTYRRIAA
jgi:Cu-processing system ATP-binding protein